MDAELTAQLEGAMAELESLREWRARQMERVEAVVRQRDMYRVLLARADASYNKLDPDGMTALEDKGAAVGQGGDGGAANGSGATNTGEQVDVGLLKELQSEFEAYRKEKATDHRMLTSELETARGKAASAELDAAQLRAQLEYERERYALLAGSADGTATELSRLRDKNATFR